MASDHRLQMLHPVIEPASVIWGYRTRLVHNLIPATSTTDLRCHRRQGLSFGSNPLRRHTLNNLLARIKLAVAVFGPTGGVIICGTIDPRQRDFLFRNGMLPRSSTNEAVAFAIDFAEFILRRCLRFVWSK